MSASPAPLSSSHSSTPTVETRPSLGLLPGTPVAASPVSDLRRHEQQELSVRYSGSPVEPKKNTVIYRCEEKPGGLPTAVRTSGITKAVSGKISIVCVCVWTLSLVRERLGRHVCSGCLSVLQRASGTFYSIIMCIVDRKAAQCDRVAQLLI